ncbi:Major Facilitator Superfamily protein [Metarhizium album ARSEF 1941]|uniref:Major Facilitator Superfamily protein n=1 Tax=Metarhizium album (strain ARSEF 1941) TaxID=1081103 RepID=A0A0B2WL87_METAS|nr:Major Facilitator Superfamily protein [Metarhizium album ARSEF 1941]KHN96816.1 Major Facilitator Superfamily protein [Metarhizium album ARSEF 1941]
MSDDESQRPPRPKLPTQQLTILAVARFAEPLATTSIYPYLPQMVRDFGVEETEVAKWAGITSAVFSVFQSFSAVPWGKIADSWGRKPSLITGLVCTMACFLVWGLSTSLPMAITVRAIQGASNGNIGIIRTMVAELVPEKELQPRAFSIMPLVWALGSVVGPAFGGFFADPARQYPSLFGGVWFFEKFPYALPNLIATVFFLVSVTGATLFLKETLAGKRDERDWGLLWGKRLGRALKWDKTQDRRRRSFVDGEATAPLVPSQIRPKKPRDLPTPGSPEIFTKQTVLIILAYFFLALHSVAFDQNVTVFLNYPVMEHTPENTKLPFYFNGGFGLGSGTIGTIFMLYGITCGLVQFILFSPMVTRWGVLNCYKTCCEETLSRTFNCKLLANRLTALGVIMPIAYILTPYTSLFPTSESRLLALAFVLALKAFSIIVAFPSVTILLTNSAKSLRILGTLNGFVTMFSGFGRALGPASTGLAFTWGAKNGYVVTAYFFLAAMAVLGAIPVFWVVEGNGPTASAEDSDAEDNETLVNSSRVLADESAIDDSAIESEESEPLLASPKSGAASTARQN